MVGRWSSALSGKCRAVQLGMARVGVHSTCMTAGRGSHQPIGLLLAVDQNCAEAACSPLSLVSLQDSCQQPQQQLSVRLLR